MTNKEKCKNLFTLMLEELEIENAELRFTNEPLKGDRTSLKCEDGKYHITMRESWFDDEPLYPLFHAIIYYTRVIYHFNNMDSIEKLFENPEAGELIKAEYKWHVNSFGDNTNNIFEHVLLKREAKAYTTKLIDGYLSHIVSQPS